MSIFEAFEIAFADRDIDALGALFHSDYERTMPSSGRTLTKKDWITGFGKILANGTVAHEKVCYLYENDHVLVTHSFSIFPNGTVDAVMWVGTKKDVLIQRVETGSTPYCAGLTKLPDSDA